VLWYVYSYTPLGRYLYFVGGGRDVARLAGIRVNAIRAGSLLTSSVLSAVAGIVLAGTLGSAEPNLGEQYLLPAFAAAFLGATAITPGRFNAWGTFVAVYFLITGVIGLQLLGLTGWVTQVFYGASLVIAVSFSHLASRRRATT
jgi:ribose transport system permease protein